MATQDISFGITFEVDYPQVIYGDRSKCQFTNGRLADATGDVVYAPGCILAVYTSGPNIGLYVNYDSVAGTNGQDVPVGVLTDDNFSLTDVESVNNLQDEILVAGNVIFSTLFATQEADIAAYITARNGLTYTSDGNVITHLP